MGTEASQAKGGARCRLLAHTILPDEALDRARRAADQARRGGGGADSDSGLSGARGTSALGIFIRGAGPEGAGLEAGQPPPQLAPDKSPSCRAWAAAGECARNPRFMQAECATACHAAPVSLPLCPQYDTAAAAHRLLMASDTCDAPPPDLFK